MEIYLEKGKKTVKKKFSGNLEKLLSSLKINPETVIVVLNNEVITEDYLLKDSDSIKILSAISGG